MKDHGIKGIGMFALVTVIYVLAYFVMMARNVPAVNKDGQIAFRSCFRMAPYEGRKPKVSPLNYLFYRWTWRFTRWLPLTCHSIRCRRRHDSSKRGIASLA